MITITGVRVVGADGASVSEPMDVEFGHVIADLRPAGAEEVHGETIDGSGCHLLAGLIDAHVHLKTEDALLAAARAGVTTLVDLGTHPDELIAAQRTMAGAPSIVSAGSAASAPGSTQIGMMGFPGESGVVDASDAERFLDWRVAGGSDLIKIIIEDPAATEVPALSPEILEALVTGAHRRGLLTVAHVVTPAAFERGLDAGVDVFTHVPLLQPLPQETVARMAEVGAVACPTLVMMRAMARLRMAEHADAAFEASLESVRRLHAGGVRILAGTDANETPMVPVQHGASLHEELALLQEAGLSAAEVLESATSAPARVLRLKDRGEVKVGLSADLLLVEGDPTHDPSVLAAPRGVWVVGESVEQLETVASS